MSSIYIYRYILIGPVGSLKQLPSRSSCCQGLFTLVASVAIFGAPFEGCRKVVSRAQANHEPMLKSSFSCLTNQPFKSLCAASNNNKQNKIHSKLCKTSRGAKSAWKPSKKGQSRLKSQVFLRSQLSLQQELPVFGQLLATPFCT